MSIVRPAPGRFLWYCLGGALPEVHREWVLHDITCRTWWARHLFRTTVYVAPLLGIYFAVLPASWAIRLLTGLTFAGGVYLFSLVNITVDTDRRMVRAGYPSDLAARIRSERATNAHASSSHERRERIAERQARRRTRR